MPRMRPPHSVARRRHQANTEMHPRGPKRARLDPPADSNELSFAEGFERSRSPPNKQVQASHSPSLTKTAIPHLPTTDDSTHKEDNRKHEKLLFLLAVASNPNIATSKISPSSSSSSSAQQGGSSGPTGTDNEDSDERSQCQQYHKLDPPERDTVSRPTMTSLYPRWRNHNRKVITTASPVSGEGDRDKDSVAFRLTCQVTHKQREPEGISKGEAIAARNQDSRIWLCDGVDRRKACAISVLDPENSNHSCSERPNGVVRSAPEEGGITQVALPTIPGTVSHEFPIQDNGAVRAATNSKPIKQKKPARKLNFPEKLMAVLSRPDTKEAITWLPHGDSFVIVSPKLFAAKVLPEFFKSAKFESFTRKLNRWRFKRITDGTHAVAYTHELFLRDRPELCKKMSGCGFKTEDDAQREASQQAQQGAFATESHLGSASDPLGEPIELPLAECSASDEDHPFSHTTSLPPLKPVQRLLEEDTRFNHVLVLPAPASRALSGLHPGNSDVSRRPTELSASNYQLPQPRATFSSSPPSPKGLLLESQIVRSASTSPTPSSMSITTTSTNPSASLVVNRTMSCVVPAEARKAKESSELLKTGMVNATLPNTSSAVPLAAEIIAAARAAAADAEMLPRCDGTSLHPPLFRNEGPAIDQLDLARKGSMSTLPSFPASSLSRYRATTLAAPPDLSANEAMGMFYNHKMEEILARYAGLGVATAT